MLRGALFARLLAISLLGATIVGGFPLLLEAETVHARHKQGSGHGFVILKSTDGKVIAFGDRIDRVDSQSVHSRLVLRFLDGSIDDETAVFRQEKVFQLLRMHHVQKGPSFPNSLNMSVDVRAGEITWEETKDGKSETRAMHMELPADLANGMVSAMLGEASRTVRSNPYRPLWDFITSKKVFQSPGVFRDFRDELSERSP